MFFQFNITMPVNFVADLTKFKRYMYTGNTNKSNTFVPSWGGREGWTRRVNLPNPQKMAERVRSTHPTCLTRPSLTHQPDGSVRVDPLGR